ncbi:MAG: condensation domain-containing protein [Cyanobacteriota bacterium]|nr:condensation domain-containing protein [Cyanobacteriota bacterium]
MNRLLGPSEHLLWVLAQTKPINVVLCATITGTLTIKQLTAALAWVQHRHPLLAVRIAIDNYEQPRFVSEGVPSIPLRIIARQGEKHWCQEAEEELLRPFSWKEGPLIRVVLLQSPAVSELIITFDHCIGDGLSGTYLIRDILREVSEPGMKQQRLPEPPPCEELIPVSARGLSRDSVDEDFENHKTAKSHLEVVTNRPSTKEILGKEQIRLLHWCLSPEETTRLVLCSRQQQTSVHGALCASFLLSVAHEVRPADETVLKCMSPLNLRNHLVPPIGEDFGAYYTRELTYHQSKPATDFWEVAREVKHQLNQVVAHGQIFAGVQKVKAFLSTKPEPSRLRQYVKGLIGSDLTVTNLGRLNIPEQFSLLHLRELYITVAGIAPIIVGVATLGGKMFVSCRYLNTVIPPACAESINKGAMQRLREAIS